jgi:hypothetical protein
MISRIFRWWNFGLKVKLKAVFIWPNCLLDKKFSDGSFVMFYTEDCKHLLHQVRRVVLQGQNTNQ